VPIPSEWHPGRLTERSPVWKEIVPGENRAITLRHPSYPYLGTWESNDPADLVKIAAGYLEGVRYIFGLPALFEPGTTKFNVPLAWLPISLDDTPAPLASVWVKRFKDPAHQADLIDRTAILLAVQSLRPDKAETALGSRLGIRIVAHVSREARPPRTVRITGSSCSTDLAKSLGPYTDSVSAFFEDFFASASARSDIERRILVTAGLPDTATIWIDGLRARGALLELWANASRPPDQPNALAYMLTAHLAFGPGQAQFEAVEKSALVASAGPMVQVRHFPQDPASEPPPAGTGDIVDARPNRAQDRLERYRQLRDLPGLTVDGLGNAHLIDDFGQVEVKQSKLVAPNANEMLEEIVKPAAVTHAGTRDFAALGGYQHARELFDTMRDYGLSPDQYFKFAAWPLLIRYRATIRPGPGKDGKTINAQVDYDPPGGDLWAPGNQVASKPLQVRFALADLKRSASRREPLGLATDPRWSWHEYGHVLLLASTGALEFLFAHSAGDALAAIRSDPKSAHAEPPPAGHPGLRGATFPWVCLNRRHDRSVWYGWSWSGTHHRPARFPLDVENRRHKGYHSEQILSTSLFRLYRALGGDTVLANGKPDVKSRQTASDYVVYLTMRAIKSLGPAFALLTETPDQLVSALTDADIGTLPTTQGPLKDRVGGWAYKVVRWAFEAQGLYATTDPLAVVNAPGEPPDVDVFVDDGRPDSEGAHPRGGYMPVSLDWNSLHPLWHATTNAVHVAGNQVSVQVRNRGRSAATGVTVRVWCVNWPTSAPDPPKWDPSTWTMVKPSTPQPVPPNKNPVAFDPFRLPPQPGRRLILAVATCVADPANVDPTASLPCATNPTPIVDLVAGDNNLGLRRVSS
jgi:hypothetical protein